MTEFLQTIFRFLTDRMFITDILVVGFLASLRFSPRKYFWLRVVVLVPAALVASYYVPKLLHSILPTGFVRSSVAYALECALAMCVIAACFKLSFQKVLYVCAFCYFIQHSAFCLDRLIRGELKMDALTYFTHFAFLLAVFAVAWLLIWRNVKEKSFHRLNNAAIVMLTLLFLTVCVVLNTYASSNGEDNFSFRVADLCCSVAGLCFQYSIFVSSVRANEKEQIQRILNESAEQYRLSKENIDALNIKCHDLKHQVRMFYDNGKIDGELVKNIEGTIALYDSGMETGNEALNVIFTEKSLLCLRNGINFTCMADGKALSFMDPIDIYALFGNALDNAITAVGKIHQPEKRVITLVMRKVGNMCSVSVQNYVDENVCFEEDVPVTTKEDKFNHGFGAKSMRHIVTKYGGEISFRQNDDVFVLNIVVPLPASVETVAA